MMPTPSALPVVCQLLHSLNVGGAEVLAARLARQLRGRYHFVFACLDELGTLGRELLAEGFRVEVMGRRSGLDWRCALRLGQFFRRHRIALVQAHQYTPFFYATLGRCVYRRPPVLFTEHGRHYPDYPRRKRMIANRLLLRKRDRVVGVGEAVRKALIDNEGLPAPRVEVIYNGVNLAPFGNGRDCRALPRRELGIPADEFVIIQVARLDYLKDHATAVRVMGRVVRQRPGARLVLVGEGRERAAIEGLVREHGLERNVHLLGLRGDIPQLLAGADLFLLTSISEGIPLTLIEAMAAGLPVVSTNVGGVAEVVVEGRTGLLAPAGDDDTLAAHVLRLAGDSALRRQMGDLGRDRAFEVFSEEEMHQNYLRTFGEMLRG